MLLVIYDDVLFYILLIYEDKYIILIFFLYLDNIIDINIQIIDVLLIHNNNIQTFYDYHYFINL